MGRFLERCICLLWLLLRSSRANALGFTPPNRKGGFIKARLRHRRSNPVDNPFQENPFQENRIGNIQYGGGKLIPPEQQAMWLRVGELHGKEQMKAENDSKDGSEMAILIQHSKDVIHHADG